MDDQLRQKLALVKRSPKDADGWCKVSANVWPIVADMPPDLVELDNRGSGGRLRLTERGKAVVDYL